MSNKYVTQRVIPMYIKEKKIHSWKYLIFGEIDMYNYSHRNYLIKSSYSEKLRQTGKISIHFG